MKHLYEQDFYAWTQATAKTLTVGVYAKLPQPSIFRSGYDRQTGLPANLKVENNILSLTRDRQRKHKIGSDASSLLWLGKKLLCGLTPLALLGRNIPIAVVAPKSILMPIPMLM